MKEVKMKITRKDGIEYERKNKTRNYDSIINIRVSRETIEDLKQIASKYGIKYNTMVREVLEDYIRKEK
jgi:predicted DNA binding CopG/RHH family protein